MNAFAIWKAYVYKGKVVYINLSSFQYGKNITQHIQVKNVHLFYANESALIRLMGKRVDMKTDESGYVSYNYLGKGIRFIMDEGELRNIYLFEPMSKRKARKWRKMIGLSPK